MPGDLVGHLLDEFRDDPEFWAELWVAHMAEDLSRWMSEKNLTSAQLGELAGIKRSSVTKMLKGDTRVTAATITKLALALGRVPRSTAWTGHQRRLEEIQGYSVPAKDPASVGQDV